MLCELLLLLLLGEGCSGITWLGVWHDFPPRDRSDGAARLTRRSIASQRMRRADLARNLRPATRPFQGAAPRRVANPRVGDDRYRVEILQPCVSTHGRLEPLRVLASHDRDSLKLTVP
jgi:hypothetical protein